MEHSLLPSRYYNVSRVNYPNFPGVKVSINSAGDPLDSRYQAMEGGALNCSLMHDEVGDFDNLLASRHRADVTAWQG